MEISYHQPALLAMRQAIAQAHGNEVFFLGRTDEERRVVEVEVLARGKEDAVPAILQLCRYGDVVIHNHPSGGLQPSSADIEIASRLGSLGVGFHIVDNSVGNVYKVVEAFAPREEQHLEPQRIGDILGPQGVVATTLPGYEDRPEQLRMAFAVGEAFNAGKLAVIEAGTGTGKSLAYLAPAILWALTNEERVVVSTNTINLQEQLVRKDLPFLQRATGLEFRAVLVKGRGNYLCLRRAENARLETGLFDEEHAAELHSIVEWAERTADGSREELPFLPPEQVWEEVRCELDQCGRVRCPHYSRCFFHKARRKAAQADILVVNHALLLSDLALRAQTDNYSAAAVLPPFDRIILDEAHHLEDVATNYFSSQVTRFAFARVLNRLRHPRQPDKGLLPRYLSALAKELPDSADELYRDLHGRIENLLAGRQALFDLAVRDLEAIGTDLSEGLSRPVREGEELKHRVLPAFTETPLWEGIAARVRALGLATNELAKGVRALLRAGDKIPEEYAEKLGNFFTDLRGIGGRLEGISADLDFFVAKEEQTCAWFEVALGRVGRGTSLVTKLCTAPLEVADNLKAAVYDRFRTVVLTSATLAVGPSFDYFKCRVGLDRVEPGRVTELLLHSPFDFARQTLVAIPTDVPEPGRPGYQEMVRDLSEQAILAADGRTFVLFTAYSLLRRVHGELAPILSARGYHCLRQGEDNRHRLLKKFAADPTSVLFGTDSFWEGVDVPGRALEQVIIARLPFKVPTEPVLEARSEAIENRGGDPFMEYTVPQAVIKFKQGFGRLIRHRDDRGVVMILDARVVKKGYGRVFLRSLPEARVVAAPSAEVLAEMRRFFAAAPPEVP
ncbi:MAG TPA: helicase C-terminal domain-containing protein [Deferrimonas sp.]